MPVGDHASMSLWLVRAGKFGEHETKFFGDGRIYLNWHNLQTQDLTGAKDYDAVKALVRAAHPGEPERRLGNWAGQIWAFLLQIKPGDIVATPRKGKSAIAFGEVKGDYTYTPSAVAPYRQSRAINWLAT